MNILKKATERKKIQLIQENFTHIILSACAPEQSAVGLTSSHTN